MAKIGGINFSGYATDPNWPNAVQAAFDSIPQFGSGADIDTHIKKIAPESPLIGQGQYIIDKATEGGYDPRVAVAVAQHESHYGTRGRAVRTMNPWNIGNDDSGRENVMASPTAAVDAFHNYATGRPQSYSEAKRLVRDPVDFEKRLRELGEIPGTTDGSYMESRKRAEEQELEDLMNWAKSGTATKSPKTPAEKMGTAPKAEPEPKAPLEPDKGADVGPSYATAHGTGEALELDAWGEAAKNIGYQLLYGPVVKDVEKGLIKSPIELGAGAYEGLRQTVIAGLELNNWMNNLAYKMGVSEGILEVGNWPFNGDPTYWEKVIPKTPESDSVTGGLIKGIGQFIPAFIATQGAVMGALGVKNLNQLTKLGRLGMEGIGIISSAVVSFDPNMSNLIDATKGTSLEEPLKAFQKNPEDSRLEKRVYNAMEMLGIGALFHGVVSGVKFMKGVEKALPELEKGVGAVAEAELAGGLVPEVPTKPGIVPVERGPHATRFSEELSAAYSKKGPKANEQLAGAQALYEARANIWASEGEGRVADDFFKDLQVAKGEKIPSELTGLQKGVDKPKGIYYSMEDGTKVIGLFTKADFSTLVHEGWHFFQESIPTELRTALGEWRGKPLESWEIGDHEHVARAFERWFAEGKGSKLDLPEPVKNIFAKFQKWMLDVYKAIKGSKIDVEMSPELEAVFQRTLGQSGEMQYGSKPFKQAGNWGRKPGWINTDGTFEPTLGGHGDIEGPLKEGKVRVAAAGNFEVDTLTPQVIDNIKQNLGPNQKVFSVDEASTGSSYMLHMSDLEAAGGDLKLAIEKYAKKEKYRPLYQEDNPTYKKAVENLGEYDRPREEFDRDFWMDRTGRMIPVSDGHIVSATKMLGKEVPKDWFNDLSLDSNLYELNKSGMVRISTDNKEINVLIGGPVTNSQITTIRVEMKNSPSSTLVWETVDGKHGTGFQELIKELESKGLKTGTLMQEDNPVMGKWYSKMVSALESGLPKRATAEKYIKLIEGLQKSGKFKEDEVWASGVIEKLREVGGEGTILKSDLMKIVEEGMPKVETDVLTLTPTKSKTPGYELDEGKAYESSIPGANTSTPEGAPKNWSDLEKLGYKLREGGRHKYYIEDPDGIMVPGSEDMTADFATRRLVNSFIKPNPDVVNLVFRSGQPLGYAGTGEAHWNMPDVLGHSRAVKNFLLKSGKSAMLVEEIQSDLHQQGRKIGYRGDESKINIDKKVIEKAIVEGPGSESHEAMLGYGDNVGVVFYDSKGGMWDTWTEASIHTKDKVGIDISGDSPYGDEYPTIYMPKSSSTAKVAEMIVGSLREMALDSQPPNAPFKDWVPFTVKQTLAYAAENGIDRVAFIGKEFQRTHGYATDMSSDITYGQELPRFLRSYAKQIGATLESDTVNIKGTRKMLRPEDKVPEADFPVTVVDISKSSIKTKGQPLFQEGEPPIPGLDRITGENKPLIEEVDKSTAEILLDDSNYPTEVVRRGKAYNFNLGYVTDENSLRELFNKVAETFSGTISDQARGQMTIDAITDLADSMAMKPGDVALWERGKAASAEEIHAARTIMSYSARKLSKVGERAAGPNATDMDVAEFTKLLGVHLAIQKSVSGMAAEAGRALRAWQIDLGPLANSRDQGAVSKHLRSLVDSMGGSDHIKEIASMLQQMDTLTQANTYLRQATRATTSDMLLEAWVNGLLSSPLTHAANTIGNTSVIPLSYLEHFAAGGIGRTLKLVGGQQGVHEMEVVARAYGALQGLGDAFRLAGKSFWNETSPFGPTRGKLEGRFRSITGENLGLSGVFGQAADFLGNVIRLPGRGLIAADTFFRTIAYRSELNGLGWRTAMHEGLSGDAAKLRIREIVEHPEDFDAIRLSAIDAGDYYTFNKQLGPTGQRLIGFTSSHPLLRILAPFIRTPINIMKFTGERTPLALASQAVRAEIMSGDPARRDLALAKIAVGSIIMMLAGNYATSGSVTGGGPKDPTEKAALRRTGWQPYSIKVGDTYYSFQRTEPIGSLLGLAADAVDIWGMAEEGDADKMASAAVMAIAKNVTSKTFLTGISNFMEFLSEPERFGGSYIKKMLAGMVVPSGVAQMERVTDPVMSDARSVLDEIKSRIPGLSDTVPPLRNLWGEPVELGGGWGPDLISPIYTSEETKSPIDEEIVKNKVRIQALPRTIMGGQYGHEVNLTGDVNQYMRERGVHLTSDEYDRFQVIFGKEVIIDGQRIKDYLNTVVSSAEYRSATGGPEGGRAMMIKTVISTAKQEALRMLLEERLELKALVEKRAQDRARRLMGE